MLDCFGIDKFLLVFAYPFYHNYNKFSLSPVYTCLEIVDLVGVLRDEVVGECFNSFQQIVLVPSVYLFCKWRVLGTTELFYCGVSYFFVKIAVLLPYPPVSAAQSRSSLRVFSAYSPRTVTI